MIALDLFCGGGGVSVGLERAGFDVVGVDNEQQPDYPSRFDFVHGDALSFLRVVELDRFDLVWASPPCPAYSTVTRDAGGRPRLIDATRTLLEATGKPYVIENVIGAHSELRGWDPQLALFDGVPSSTPPVLLCGAMFGLGVVRHRYFETNWRCPQPAHVEHVGSLVTGEYVTVTGKGGVPAWTLAKRDELGIPRHFEGESSLPRWREAMGIDWMGKPALVQAIPPAFAEHIGRAFLASRPSS